MSEPQDPVSSPAAQTAGRRKRSNPWLAHVKDTMKKNRGVSFKNILKIAKKSFKSKSKSKSKFSRRKSQSQSQSQSQSGGKKHKKRGGFKLGQEQQQQEQQEQQEQQQQQGGSGVGGGKEGAATLAGNAAPVA